VRGKDNATVRMSSAVTIVLLPPYGSWVVASAADNRLPSEPIGGRDIEP